MLLDSNIIVYAAQPDHGDLRAFIAEQSPVVSAISVVEVLGYHALMDHERLDFEAFFAASTVLPVSDAVVLQAVRLRQLRRIHRTGFRSWVVICIPHGPHIGFGLARTRSDP